MFELHRTYITFLSEQQRVFIYFLFIIYLFYFNLI